MKTGHAGLKIDLSRDSLFDELGIKRLKESYMRDDEVSPQERFAHVSEAFGTDKEHSQRLYEYASKHWLSYSTPVLAYGRTKRGLPISCFLPYLHDSAEGLVDCQAEVNWLSMLGGGIGIGVGIRSADDKSVGVMPHLRTYDTSCLAYRQGSTRRGSYAAYLDINHPDIVQFLDMRRATGDQNMRCQNLHHGVNITDDFMQIIENCMKDPNADDKWELRDPNNSVVREVVSAKDLWQRIIELRMQTGEPYLHFIDASNRSLNEFQKKLGLKIRQSNLCVTGDTSVTIKLSDGEIIDCAIEDVGSYLEEFGQCYIWSRNLTTGQDEFFPIIAWGLTNENAEIMKITDENTGYSITCTEDHKLFTTNRGWVEAKNLVETDNLKFVDN
jgi:ribonucleoside-diphosphate reductase alpha chain